MKRTLAEYAPLWRIVGANIAQAHAGRRMPPKPHGLGLALLSFAAWLGAAIIFGLALEPVSIWLRAWIIGGTP